MNSKQMIRDAIALKSTPRLPVALLSGGVWTFNRRGKSLQELLDQPELAAEMIVGTNQVVGSDIVWPGSGYHNLAIRALGGAIKFRSKGAPDVQTPVLQNLIEIEQVQLAKLQEDSAIQTLRRVAELLVQRIGDETMIGASQWGPFTLAGHFYGIEKLMRAIYKDQTAVAAVLDLTMEVCCQYLKLFVDAGVEIVSIAEPSASGDLISRKQFQEFVLPHLKQTVTRLKAQGVLVCLHICGNITNRLDVIADSGVDLLSVDFKVDLSQVKAVLGNKIAFAGNMNPVAVMQNASSETVTATCLENIAKVGETPGYILMPGCDLPPGVPLENLQAMVAAAHRSKSKDKGVKE